MATKAYPQLLRSPLSCWRKPCCGCLERHCEAYGERTANTPFKCEHLGRVHLGLHDYEKDAQSRLENIVSVCRAHIKMSRRCLRSLVRSEYVSVAKRRRHVPLYWSNLYPRRRVTFITKEGEHRVFHVDDGTHLLEVALANQIEIEGACGGCCACSTCHVIVDSHDLYSKMSKPTEDEVDMLDQSVGYSDTSRLGCQVEMCPELDGLVVRLPVMTDNMQASGGNRCDI